MSPALRRSLALAISILVLPASPAGAVSGPLVSGYVADGPVFGFAVDGQGRAYLGGAFSHIGPRIGHGAVFSTSSSAPATDLPDINGDVNAAIADGSGGWFIGGSFSMVGGVARSDLAHIKADRTLDAAWNPGANNVVRALALSGGSLYVGGDFTRLADTGRGHLAKVSATTGALDTTFVPTVNSSVKAVAVIGSNVYVGTDGNTNIAAGGFPFLARYTTTDGSVDPSFAPNVDQVVRAFAVSGTTLYAGGGFTAAGGTGHRGLVKIDTTVTSPSPDSGVDTTWAPGTDQFGPSAGVFALQLVGAGDSDLIVGGLFSKISGSDRLGIGKVSTATTGALDPNWHPDTDSQEVRALALSGDDVVVGGNVFTTLGGQAHASLGKVSLSTGNASATWNPNTGATVNALAFSGAQLLAGGSFVSAGPDNVARNAIARLNADGTLDLGWDPNITIGFVKTMVVSGSNLFVGGNFQRVGGSIGTPNLVKISTSTGLRDSGWTPSPDGEIDALALSGSDLFVGGAFFNLGLTARSGLAKVATGDPATVDPSWNPNPGGGTVQALAVSGSDLFVGGSFAGFGGGAFFRNRIAKVSTTTGAVDPDWDPNASSTVWSLAVSGSDVFAGGNFTTIGGQNRAKLARIPAAGNGTADATWNPSVTSGGASVFGLAVDGNRLLAAGAFTTVGGQQRLGLARVATTGTGAVDAGLIPPLYGGGPPAAVAPWSASRLLVGGSFTNVGPYSLGGFAVYDLTPPTASITVPGEGGRYPQGKPVNAAYSCADPDGASNVVSCTGPVASGAAFDTSTPGAKTFAVTATDAGGDTGSQSVNYIVDASAPTVTVSSPAEGASLTKGQVVTADYACGDADGPSDVASCSGPVASGAPIDTSTAGTHTFTVTSADVAGNQATTAVSYTVSVPAVPDTTAPAITGWRIRPTSFRAASSGASVAATKKTPVGARVSYALSEAAPKVVVTVLQVRKGKKPLSLGRFTVKGKAGANRFQFTGRLNGGKLAPGRYRLSAQASDAAKNTSKAALADFRIVNK